MDKDKIIDQIISLQKSLDTSIKVMEDIESTMKNDAKRLENAKDNVNAIKESLNDVIKKINS
ncbi:MAG: hypothetical protein ACP5N1_05245 [Candidatus Woesearchaeota archaeon]